MPTAHTVIAHRPHLDRDRTLFVLHPDHAECEKLAVGFGENGFSTVGLTSIEALPRLMSQRRPDVVLIDLGYASGNVDMIAMLRDILLGARVFVLADPGPDLSAVIRAGRAGALGIFTRPFNLEDMVSAVRGALLGDPPGKATLPQLGGLSSLTKREREVLHHIVEGQSNKQVAISLEISPRTVEVHRASAMHKLGARNTAELVRIALAN